MIKWMDIPRGQRPTISALIETACSSCKIKNRYIEAANKIGYLEALSIIEIFPEHQSEMFKLLKTTLEVIRDEQSR